MQQRAGRTQRAPRNDPRFAEFDDIDEPFYRLTRREPNTRYSSARLRRRRWSDWNFTVNTNTPLNRIRRQYGDAVADATAEIMIDALQRVAAAIFENPEYTRYFMETAPGEYRDAGDRFNDEHVFDNQYWINVEIGPHNESVHASFHYRVLHDSRFRVNAERFRRLLAREWPNAIRSIFIERPDLTRAAMLVSPEALLRTENGRPKVPGVFFVRGYKTDQQAQFYWEKNARDIRQRARWTSRARNAAWQSEGARFSSGAPAFPPILSAM